MPSLAMMCLALLKLGPARPWPSQFLYAHVLLISFLWPHAAAELLLIGFCSWAVHARYFLVSWCSFHDFYGTSASMHLTFKASWLSMLVKNFNK